MMQITHKEGANKGRQFFVCNKKRYSMFILCIIFRLIVNSVYTGKIHQDAISFNGRINLQEMQQIHFQKVGNENFLLEVVQEVM